MYRISTSSLQSIYAPSAKTKSSDGKMSFSEYLDSVPYLTETETVRDNTAANKAIIALQKQSGTYDPHNNANIQIPDSWYTEWDIPGVNKSGVDAAEKFLRENGVDIEKIVPSHDITDEQMEWLKSRHDFSNMELQLGSPECQNLWGDLIVLGVCTYDEIMQLFAVQMPENGVLCQAKPNDLGIGGLGIGTGSSSLKRTFQYTFDTQNAILSAFMNSMGNKPLSALNEADQRFVKSASELLSKKQDIYELLLGLFE